MVVCYLLFVLFILYIVYIATPSLKRERVWSAQLARLVQDIIKNRFVLNQIAGQPNNITYKKPSIYWNCASGERGNDASNLLRLQRV